ncbi:chorismate mutase [Pseudochelatococcus sp. G4_1912]|uniref:chorismate mutase n=1 Tax=Pseudochelatococcus sp. G4_1912 TaxID=3114288 RepID=UPI0039C5A9FA
MTDDREKALAGLRAEIDALDTEIVGLLARRIAIVDRVIVIKREHDLPALIPSRVEEVASLVRERASEAGVSPDFTETVWRAMMDWVIAYEDRQLKKPGSDDGVA